MPCGKAIVTSTRPIPSYCGYQHDYLNLATLPYAASGLGSLDRFLDNLSRRSLRKYFRLGFLDPPDDVPDILLPSAFVQFSQLRTEFLTF
jgi:hypothetical protein